MVVEIPSDFNYKTEQLDVHETHIRDVLNIDISRWAEFRRAVGVGNHAERLHSSHGPIADEVKQAYRELAKSHYEAVLSIGFMKQALNAAERYQYASMEMNKETTANMFAYERSKIDFYLHSGRVLDNLARLIFIVNDANAATETDRRHGGDYLRHWIDWAYLSHRKYPGYEWMNRSTQLKEIRHVRNVLTHGWSVPVKGILQCWPTAIRRERAFYWWYDERPLLEQKYQEWVPIVAMLSDDFIFLERFQNLVFRKLTKHLKRFEIQHRVEIRG